MSVYYNVKEYLEVPEVTEESSCATAFARAHLAWLGWKMLLGSANARKISLVCGEKNFCFSGNTVGANFHEMIRTLDDAAAFVLTMDYSYTWRGTDPESACDHQAFSSYLDQEDVPDLGNAFYTMYCNADCEQSAGILCAYGEKNGRLYKGIVQDESISEFPDSGDWYNPGETVVCDLDAQDKVDMTAVWDIVKQLETLSEGDNLTDSKTEFAYYMNNFQAKGAEDFKKFVYLSGRLIELTDGKCSVCAELVDRNDPYGRILKIDVESSEKYTIIMAAVG